MLALTRTGDLGGEGQRGPALVRGGVDDLLRQVRAPTTRRASVKEQIGSLLTKVTGLGIAAKVGLAAGVAAAASVGGVATVAAVTSSGTSHPHSVSVPAASTSPS